MHPRFSQGNRDADLVVLRELDSSLLLAVTQRDVVYLQRLGKGVALGDFVQKVPGAGEPLIRSPGRLSSLHGHENPYLLLEFGCSVAAGYFSAIVTLLMCTSCVGDDTSPL